MTRPILLIVGLALAGPALLAQPALTLNVLPEIGDQAIFYEADSNSISNAVIQTTAGANKTWNFGNLQPLSGVEAIPYFYLAPSATPAAFAAEYPTSNYALKIDSDSLVLYGYGRKETGQFSFLGTASDSFLQKYTDPDIQLKPLSFNGSFEDDFAYTTESPDFGVLFYSEGSRTVTYDAYGTLTTPAGTFQNAMRVKSVATQVDSTDLGFLKIINNTDITTYDWFVANQPGALVSVSYVHVVSTITIIGLPPEVNDLGTIKTVNYISNLLVGAFDRPDELNGISIRLGGANPVSDDLRVTVGSEKRQDNLTLLVTDLNGRILVNQPLAIAAGDNALSLPVGHLAAGAYFLTLTDGNALRTLSWQKQ